MIDEYKAYLENTSNLIILYNLKRDGLPESDEEMTLLFRKLNGHNSRNNGDYPVHWDDINDFLPEIETTFGEERYLNLHRDFDLQGPDIKKTIQNTKDMAEVDKEFLYFVYEI